MPPSVALSRFFSHSVIESGFVMNDTIFRLILLPVIFMETSEIPLKIKTCGHNDTLFEKHVF